MLRRICKAMLAVGLAVATPAFGQVTIVEDPGTPNITTVPLSGFATTGEQMAGMVVRVVFGDASSETAMWEATGSGAGGVFGTGWEITQSGNSFLATRPWTLLNNSGKSIVELHFDGGPGDTLFDRTFDGLIGTEGSALGRDFALTTPAGALDILVTYQDIVGVQNAAPVGDIWRRMNVQFRNMGGLANSSSVAWACDTDNIEFGGDIVPDSCVWENGDWDAVSGQSSEEGTALGAPSASADDFRVCEGKALLLTQVKTQMLTNTQNSGWLHRRARLDVYADCNGCPGELIASYTTDQSEELGPQVGTLKLVEFTFDLDGLWLCGPNAFWISSVGLGDGTGQDRSYWATAGAGNVQLHQGKFRTDKQDIATHGWVDVGNTDGCPSCLGCTDFSFELDGDLCDILWDNGDYDGGAGGPSELNTAIPMARTADDFHLKGCQDYDVCFISGCILTNCDPKRALLEIYANDCDSPSELIRTYSNPVIRQIDAGPCADVQDLGDLTAYEVFYEVTDLRLSGGKNYWVSLVGRGTGALRERSYFCSSFRCDEACNVKINPASVRSMSLGVADWTSINEVAGGEARDMTFKVAGRAVQVPQRGQRDGRIIEKPQSGSGRVVQGLAPSQSGAPVSFRR